MKLNKKGASLKTFLFAFMFASLIGIGLYSALIGGVNNYGVDISSSYSNTFAQLNESIVEQERFAQEFQEKVETSEGVGNVGASLSLTTSIFKAILLPFTLILPSILNLIADTTGILGIPIWVGTGITTLMVLSIVIIVISIVRGKDKI